MLKYKNYSLIKPNSVQNKRISDLIVNHDGSVFHEIDLNKIIEENYNSELFYLVDNPNDIDNFSPVHITRAKFGLKRYHFKPLYDIPYAGFLKEGIVNFNNITIGLFDSLVYSGFPRIKKLNDKAEIELLGETSIVDLSLDEDDIFKNIIHSKRRNMIRKAIKCGITIRKFQTIDGLNLFWPMVNQLHKKLGYTNLTYEYYKKIFETYSVKKQAFVLIAYKNEKPISGVLILGNLNYMHYYKGASDFNVKNEGQGELLQWEAIRVSKSLGVKFYDLCNLDQNKLPSIYRFKTGISREIFKYSKYSKNELGYKIITRISNSI